MIVCTYKYFSDFSALCYLIVLSAPPSIASLTFDPGSFTLTCTSIGSPATTITWMKDGSPLVINGTTYCMEQTVTERPTSTYDNVLTIVDSGSSFGTYSCEVSNALGSSGPTSVTGQFKEHFTCPNVKRNYSSGSHAFRWFYNQQNIVHMGFRNITVGFERE